MTHYFHDNLPGYDARQILHDGCPECEKRGEDVAVGIAALDGDRFVKAWRRAFDRYASRGDDAAVGPVSEAEDLLLRVLWAVQLQLERRGVPLAGDPPTDPILHAVVNYLGAA